MHPSTPFLEELASTSSGHTLRDAAASLGKGGVHVVQVSDASGSELAVEAGELALADIDGRSLANRLRPGDILFRTRGQSNQATLVVTVPEPTVALSPLVVIRVRDTSAVLPGYLCWVLNSEGLGGELDREARGTIIRMVGAGSLRKLPIPLPPLAVQQHITRTAELARREQDIGEQLRLARHRFVEQVLWRCAAQDTG